MADHLPFFEQNAKGQDVYSFHQSVEIVFMLTGSGKLKLDGKHYSVKKEDIFLINRGQLHSLILDPNSISISFFIPLEYLTVNAPEEVSHSWTCLSFLNNKESQRYFDEVRGYVRQIYDIQNQNGRTIAYRRSILQLLDALDRYYLDSRAECVNRNDSLTGILHFIAEHYRDDISLKDIASDAHFTPEYLSRLFKKEMDMTVHQYITDIRVSKAASLLRNTNQSITEIALDVGFGNSNLLISAFRKKYGDTPGKYRNRKPDIQELFDQARERKGSLNFENLFKYSANKEAEDDFEIQDVIIDTLKKGKRYDAIWNKVVNVAYANDLLSARIQRQLSMAQEQLKFSYARFLGITSDNMIQYVTDENGKTVFYFDLIDEAVDFLLSIGLKPHIVLCYTPEIMVKNKVKAYFNAAYVCLPSDLSLWLQLIQNMLHHFIDRYGAEAVRLWKYELWNHPEVGFIMKMYDEAMYYDFFLRTFQTIKAIDEDLMILGPTCPINSWEFNERFLSFCQEHDCVPDELSYISFNFRNEEDGDKSKLIRRMDTLNEIISNDSEYLIRQKHRLDNLLEKIGIRDKTVSLVTWNSTSWQRDYVNDTAYKAAFIFRDVWKATGEWDSIAYWFFFDFVTFEEVQPSAEIFHGGFGLITNNGIPKCGFRAMQLLTKAGNSLLLNKDGVAVTREKNKIIIFLYHCPRYAESYCYQNTENINTMSRYRVFEAEKKLLYRIRLTELESGICTIRTYRINKECGNAYDRWVEMGAPVNPNDEEMDYLIRNSYPEYHVERMAHEGELEMQVCLEMHTAEMIEFELSS